MTEAGVENFAPNREPFNFWRFDVFGQSKNKNFLEKKSYLWNVGSKKGSSRQGIMPWKLTPSPTCMTSLRNTPLKTIHKSEYKSRFWMLEWNLDYEEFGFQILSEYWTKNFWFSNGYFLNGHHLVQNYSKTWLDLNIC